MNRKQRRRIENELMRENNISRQTAKAAVLNSEIKKKDQDLIRAMTAPKITKRKQEPREAWQDGMAVRINADRVMQNREKLSENYLSFVREHHADTFHISREDPKCSENLVVFVEDPTEPKWLWHVTDLIGSEGKTE